MKIFANLRYENASLVTDICDAGHELYMPRHICVYFRKLLQRPIQPVDFADPDEDDMAKYAAPFEHANRVPSIIDGFLDAHAKHKFDAVLLWSDAPTLQRCIALAARHVGVPSFEVTHGATQTYRQGHFEVNSHVDKILSPGQHEVDFRRFYAQGDWNCIVTGKPSLDWLGTLDKAAARSAMRGKFGIPEDRPCILYAMTWRHPFSVWERDTDHGELAVLQAHMNLLPVCNPYLIIKPHYAVGSEEYAAAVTRMCNDNRITDFGVMTGDPTFPLLCADLVVTHKSSIMVEAILLDLPVVMFEFREYNDFAWFQNKGAELVEKREDLLPAMTRALLDNGTRRRLATERQEAKHYFNGPCDGKAGQRCVKAIEEVVNGHSTS